MRERQERARERVNRVSKEQGITKTFIAKQIGLSHPTTFYHWLKGDYEFSISRLSQLERFLDKY